MLARVGKYVFNYFYDVYVEYFFKCGSIFVQYKIWLYRRRYWSFFVSAVETNYVLFYSRWSSGISGRRVGIKEILINESIVLAETRFFGRVSTISPRHWQPLWNLKDCLTQIRHSDVPITACNNPSFLKGTRMS